MSLIIFLTDAIRTFFILKLLFLSREEHYLNVYYDDNHGYIT